MNQHLSLDNPNVAMLEMVVRELGEVCDRLVFVGGCATDLLVEEPRSQQSRATEDVDVVTQATTIREYHQIESLLRTKKFQTTSRPTRRFAAGSKVH